MNNNDARFHARFHETLGFHPRPKSPKENHPKSWQNDEHNSKKKLVLELVFLDLLVRCLEKVNQKYQTYSPKMVVFSWWWILGSIRKNHQLNKSKTTIALLQGFGNPQSIYMSRLVVESHCLSSWASRNDNQSCLPSIHPCPIISFLVPTKHHEPPQKTIAGNHKETFKRNWKRKKHR